MTDRAAFETWIAAPPFERDVSRWPNDDRHYAWPGCYRDIIVDIAWDAWQAATAAEREACAKVCEDEKAFYQEYKADPNRPYMAMAASAIRSRK